MNKLGSIFLTGLGLGIAYLSYKEFTDLKDEVTLEEVKDVEDSQDRDSEIVSSHSI